ncbi:MFS transporter [Streptomyces sp. NBC_00525]|uniref:MFS transporter n=1 Tax=Streptomyces sp. NBC_00525 TaxID=2903660 RepID=UPI002E81B1EC|nr:MFS transporter [Streptomyces sp. NBC_00525]WUC95463.1 MFS transporter [Streptomyces sp. NBC_00525]
MSAPPSPLAVRTGRGPAAALPGAPFPAQLGLLTVLAVAVPAQLYLAIPMAGPFQDAFGVDAGAAAWAGSCFSLCYALGFLLFGPLADRVGHRPVLVHGTVATALATAALCLAPGYGWFLALRAAQGLAAASFAPVALAYAARTAGDARRPLALSVLTTGLLGSGIAGQVLGQGVAGHAPWQAVFWPAAVLYAGAALGLRALLRPPVADASVSFGSTLTVLRALLRDRRAVAVFASALTVFGSFVALYAVLNRHLADAHGLGGGQVLAVQAIGAAGLLVAPVAHRLAGGRGPGFLAVAGFLTAAAGLLTAQLTGALALPVLGSVVFVAGIGLTVPSLVGLLHRIAPASAGTAVAFNTFLLFVGASAGQLVAAYAGYRTTLGIFCVAVLLAARAVATAGRPRAPRP